MRTYGHRALVAESTPRSEATAPYRVLLVEDDYGEVELLDQLARVLARAESRGGDVGVLVAGFADLDWLSEALVPTAIERLVARAADRLARRVRGGDVLARLDATRSRSWSRAAAAGASSRRSRRVSVT
jgi:hypothetical protein